MADVEFNVAKGETNAYVRRVADGDPSSSRIVRRLFQTIQADALLIDHATAAAILAAGGGTANVEADFTNYAPDILDSGDLTVPTPDNVNDNQYSEVPDWVIAVAGNGTNNSIVKVIYFYLEDIADVADDTAYKPLVAYDLSFTTAGTQVVIGPTAGQVFYVAQ